MLPYAEFLRRIQEGAATQTVANQHAPAVHYLACSQALDTVRAALTKADGFITATELELQNTRLAVNAGRTAVEVAESVLAVTATSLGLQEGLQRTALSLPYASVFQGFGCVGIADYESSGFYSDLSPPAAGHAGSWPHPVPWTLLDFANMASETSEFCSDGSRNHNWIPRASELGLEAAGDPPSQSSSRSSADEDSGVGGEEPSIDRQEAVRGSGGAALGPPPAQPSRYNDGGGDVRRPAKGLGKRYHPIHGESARLVPGFESSHRRERRSPPQPKWSEKSPILGDPLPPATISQSNSSSGKGAKRERPHGTGNVDGEPPSWCARREQPRPAPTVDPWSSPTEVGAPTEVGSDEDVGVSEQSRRRGEASEKEAAEEADNSGTER